MAMFINLATYYLIGMPIAALLGFQFKLYAKVKLQVLINLLAKIYYFTKLNL